MNSGTTSRTRKIALLLFVLSVALATHAFAAAPEDWRAKLPARLRAAIESSDWQRYYVVPQPRPRGGATAGPAAVRGLDGLQRRYPGPRSVAVD